MSGQQHAPAALYPQERPGTHFTGGWVATGPVWSGGKSRPHRDSIPNRPARSQSLYRLSYRAHVPKRHYIKIQHIYMPIIVQQDATTYSLFISVNRSTCFGWYLYLSSGAQVTVSTPSGLSIWTGTAVPIQSRSRQFAVKVLLMPGAVDTVT